ncbi:MAG TPA: sugar phosphate isomerase/epimerase family protein [Baekduia sp.]|nr:sugar phosphate isomerase/epimerase family protein [Baekduia sp.]
MESNATSLRLSAATFGYFHHEPPDIALREVGNIGFTEVELTAGHPHIDFRRPVAQVAAEVAEWAQTAGVSITTLNAAELNLISPLADVREISLRHYRWCLELAGQLRVDFLVLIPGRRSLFAPMPDAEANALFDEQLGALAATADRHDVTIAVETAPFGFMARVAEIRDALARQASDRLAITVDAANVLFAGCDPSQQLLEAGDLMSVAHFSDTWRERLAHTRIGTAEVDLAAYVRTLHEMKFTGPVVYELADGQHPTEGLREDAAQLRALGFALSP